VTTVRPAGFLRSFTGLTATAVATPAVLWAAGALYFDLPFHPVIRDLAAIIWLVGSLTLWFFVRGRFRPRLAVGIIFLGILGSWLTIQPQQNRDWKPGVAVLAYADVNGDQVTIHNVRNFDYRTESDFMPRREMRSYHLSNLRGVDLFMTYWGSAFMAHPILSFDFGDDGRVCFSIETRSQRDQSYSALGGLYRQFELVYVVSDERDVIRLRTNFRKAEDVYLYRFNASPKTAREVFLEYIRTLNELYEHPRWYNAIENNCTTAIRNQRAAAERAPWDWRMLANGYADQMLYARGTIDRRSLPFNELKRRAHINERARAANDAPDFSERIRTQSNTAWLLRPCCAP
jgi:hypothetical protein